jgi:hypothetical protein
MLRWTLVALLLIVGMMLQAPSLHADSFLLTTDHCSGGCGPAPFGTVTLTQAGANVNILVSLMGTNQFLLTGAADTQYFKFNGAPSLASISVDQTAAGTHLIADTGSFNGDGTGSFSFGITCDAGICGNGASNALPIGTILSFHVAGTTLAALEGTNSTGFSFVADILSGTTGQTGPVASTGPVPSVPEPSSIFLLGSGLVAIAAAARRSRKKE